MRIRRTIFQNVDWTIIFLFLILTFMGWLNIYAATYNDAHNSIFDVSQSYGKQLIWIFTAFFLATIFLMMDSKFFETFAFPVYGFGIILLIAVLIFGREIKGAKSWFVIANTISFQPSEIAKYGTALALTSFLSGYNIKIQKLSTRLKATAFLALPAALILLQPDTGSMLVFCSFIFVLYREGLSGNFLLTGVAAIVLFIVSILFEEATIELPFDLVLTGKYILLIILTIIAGLVYWVIHKYKRAIFLVGTVLILCFGYIFSVNYIFNDILSDHQRDRINELLGVTFDPTGAGYNVHQSKIAIGSGGFSGKGYLQGTQTKFDFVPEQSTDFIFCTVGEEWGFIGTFVVLSLFMTLIIRIIFVAERQKSNFTRIYGYCVASILFFHLLVNIGMTIGLAPVIGIPLPFFSYGGSSLWSFTVLLFTFIKLDSERKMVLR